MRNTDLKEHYKLMKMPMKVSTNMSNQSLWLLFGMKGSRAIMIRLRLGL